MEQALVHAFPEKDNISGKEYYIKKSKKRGKKMKKLFKTLIAVVLVLCLMAAAVGCGATAQESKETTRTIKDFNGNEIEIPNEVTKVAPGVNSMSQITAMLGGSDKIVAAGKSIMKNDYFKKVFPDFNPQYSNDNIEEVLASGAQVVFAPQYDEATVAQYKEAGVAYIYLGKFANIEEFMWVIETIGDILGGEAVEKADAFVKYFNDTLAAIQEKTNTLQDSDKVRVMALSNKDGAYSIGTSSNMQNSYLKAVGGILYSDDFNGSINVEEIIKFNPQVIFCDSAEKEALMTVEDLQEVSAIKEGRVYILPFGTFGWGVNNAEAAGMAPLYYAKCMYPDLFEDIDMIAKTQEFYKQFYNYDLPAEEAQAILDATLGSTSAK